MALKRSSVQFRLAPPQPVEIIQVVSIERKFPAEAHRLRSPELRLLRHAHRLGSGDDRRPKAAHEQGGAAAHPQRHTRSACAPRISQQIQTPAKPYRELLAIVYRRLAEEWGVGASWSDCVAYGRSIRNWPPFADTVAALEYLKRHYKLIILSNVDNESFAASNEKLKIAFDAIYTAEDCGSYKPSSRNFDYMLAKLETLGIKKGGILHTAEKSLP